MFGILKASNHNPKVNADSWLFLNLSKSAFKGIKNTNKIFVLPDDFYNGLDFQDPPWELSSDNYPQSHRVKHSYLWLDEKQMYDANINKIMDRTIELSALTMQFTQKLLLQLLTNCLYSPPAWSLLTLLVMGYFNVVCCEGYEANSFLHSGRYAYK